MDEKQEKNKLTRISLHSVKNLLGSQQQTSLFSNHDIQFAEQYNIELFERIDKFGAELSDIQSRMVEGLIRGFSETGYKGNISPKDVKDVSEEKYDGKIPEGYKYINEIPRLRITQSQILDLAGINKNSIASKTRAIEALRDLGTTQYCFYYDRLAFSEDGTPQKGKDGRWKKEKVSTVDTLFTIKEVSEKGGQLSYYEITPSSIFLDQIEGFFLLIPYKWREEVRKLFGNKKASAYTFRFLLFLRYQYELRRRSRNSHSQYVLKWSPEEIAVALKMPESIYHRKKMRMHQILEDAYQVAKQLGYLSEYERLGHIDVLTFNDKKYSLHQNAITLEKEPDTGNDSETKQAACQLLDTFVKARKTIDDCFELEKHEIPSYISDFMSLLEKRQQSDIEILITWSTTQRYWSSRLSTPCKIKKLFSEAWVECQLSKKLSVEEISENNRNLAWEKLRDIHEKCERQRAFKGGESRLLILNKGVEITVGNRCKVIEFGEPDFLGKLRESLKKHRVPVEL